MGTPQHLNWRCGESKDEIARQCGLDRERLYKSLSKQGNPE
jgi:DNA-binding phage protein